MIARLAISGSRRIPPALASGLLLELVAAICSEPRELAVGGCPTGVDQAARELAASNFLWPLDDLVVFGCRPRPPAGWGGAYRQVADWEKDGRAAGPLRNQALVDWCEALLALPCEKSRGTWDAVRKAQAAGKQVYICELKGGWRW